MKKAFIILTALLISVSVFTGVISAAEYKNIGELFVAWSEIHGYDVRYPEYVSGVWSVDGSMDHLMVGLTDNEAGRAGKEEILLQIEDDDSVGFTFMKYSYAELFAIQKELAEQMSDDTPFSACGVDEMKNAVWVYLVEDHPDTENAMEELWDKYGDRVVFELGSEIVAYTEMKKPAPSSDALPWFIAAASVCGLLICGFVLIKKRAAVASNGEIITEKHISAGEVKEICSNALHSPSEALDEKIISSCKK